MEFQEMFRESYSLSQQDTFSLFSHMEKILLSKKDVIVREGQMDHYIYFVEQGLVRSFILRDGKSITMSLAKEGQTPICSLRFSEATVSRYTLVAVENCIVWRMSRKKLGTMFKDSIVFANFGRVLAENYLIESEGYWTDFYWMDKKDQYKLILDLYPDLLHRVPLTEIASWLNITPQSLSRIRNNIT